MTSQINDGETGEKPVSDENIDERISWRCWLQTLLAGSGAILVFVFNGVTEAQSGTMLPQLKKKDSCIHVTPDEETWIASLGILLSPVAAIFSGPAIDAFGRKKGLQFYYLSKGLGFAVIAFAREVNHIYIGRCICAVSLGLEVVATVYLAEIATKQQRGFIYSLTVVFFSLGIVLNNVFGYLPWQISSGIFSLSCFTIFIIQCCAPESPAWLYKSRQVDASTESLKRLGRSTSGIHQELKLLHLTSNEETWKMELKTFLEPTVWKPFVIISFFHFIQSGIGTSAIVFYSVDFIQALGTTYNPLDVTVLMSIAKLASITTIGIYCTTYRGRKFATAVSCLWIAISFTGLGAYELIYRDTIEKPFQWLPVALMINFISACAVGVTGLPWLMAGEMFPLKVRGAMNGAVFLVGIGFMFTAIKIYAFFKQVLHIWGLLFMFTAFACLGVLFGVFVLPETQNKTLYEIEQGFLPKKKMRPNAEVSE